MPDKRDRCQARGGVWDDDEELCVIPCSDGPTKPRSISFKSGVSWSTIFVSVTVSIIGVLLYLYGGKLQFFEGITTGDIRVTALGVIAIGFAGLLGEVASYLHSRVTSQQ